MFLAPTDDACVLLFGFEACPGMRLVVYLGKVLEVKVHIYLSSTDIRVPQKFLHTAKIIARFKQMGRE